MLIECNIEDHLHFMEDDPVRPDLFRDDTRRFQGPFRVFADVDEEGNPNAVICVVLTSFIPKDETELWKLSAGELLLLDQDDGELYELDGDPTVLCPYSVWSYGRGHGRQLINDLIDMAPISFPTVECVVTMSPTSRKVMGFHLGNGAEVVAYNESTINYGYEVAEDVVLH